jgi:hypothetical protein
MDEVESADKLMLLRSYTTAAKLRLMYVLGVHAEQKAIMFGNAVIYAKTSAGRHQRGMNATIATSAGNLFPSPSTTLHAGTVSDLHGRVRCRMARPSFVSCIGIARHRSCHARAGRSESIERVQRVSLYCFVSSPFTILFSQKYSTSVILQSATIRSTPPILNMADSSGVQVYTGRVAPTV